MKQQRPPPITRRRQGQEPILYPGTYLPTDGDLGKRVPACPPTPYLPTYIIAHVHMQAAYGNGRVASLRLRPGVFAARLVRGFGFSRF